MTGTKLYIEVGSVYRFMYALVMDQVPEIGFSSTRNLPFHRTGIGKWFQAISRQHLNFQIEILLDWAGLSKWLHTYIKLQGGHFDGMKQ